MRIRYALILCAVLAAAIPLDASAGQTYKVRKGDNLSRIAKRFHVKADKIIEANGLESDRLMPGMRLTLPSSPVKPKKKVPQTAGPRPSHVDAEAVAGSPQGPRSRTEETGEMLSPIAGRRGKRAPRASRLALELKELVDSPVVREIKELSEPVAGGYGVGGIKEKLIRIARKMLDIPYRFGGSSFLGIDCSAYVQKVFSLLDIMLPRTAREQFGRGKRVGREDLSAGDLVFFRTYAKFPSHVGIYLGDNQFIHASSTERKVTIDRLDAPYFVKRFAGARRLPLDEPADEI
jgi:cell wall-associated NlpC family hydrolase